MTTEPRLAGQPEDMRSGAALRINRFRTYNPLDVRRFLAAAYKPAWQLDGFAKDSSFTVRRQAAPGVSIDELIIGGAMNFQVRTADALVMIRPRAGSLILAGDAIRATDVFVLNADASPSTLRAERAQFHVVSIDANFLREVAAHGDRALPRRIEFVRARTNAGAWHRALDEVITSFNSANAARRPLMVRAASRMLTAATLECFPSNVTAESDLQATPEAPQAFREAVAFIHSNAAQGIGVNDVAKAVHLTPRAVQYVFREHANMTPTEYLRRVRLRRARVDLMQSDRSSTTVSAVARTWGFAHLGRFSAQYREAFGESPNITLRS